MNKICTSLEQSKELIELGIDVNTADMYWLNANYDEYLQCLTPYVSDNTLDLSVDIPAWSLSALIELIQDDIKIEKTLSDQSDMLTYSIIGDGYKYHSHEHECLLDAAFEFVCWLLENKKL